MPNREDLKQTLADTLATEREVARREFVAILRLTADKLEAEPSNFTHAGLELFTSTVAHYATSLEMADRAVTK